MTLNYQEIFNQVSAHLLTQNAKALTREGQECLYRDSEGRMCAIGCLIPPHLYTRDLEGMSVMSAEILTALGLNSDSVRSADVEFLHELQTIHDYATTILTWPAQLAELAPRYGLSIPPILQSRLDTPTPTQEIP